MIVSPMSVEYIDHMGTDLTICNAARVSFNKVSKLEVVCWSCGWQGAYPETDFCPNCEVDNSGWENPDDQRLSDADAKLIRYLVKHDHWSPLAHTSIQIRVKAPIFVARQLVKHQVGLVWNEVSRRYVDSEPEFWFPEVWRGRPTGSMKQGSSGTVERFNHEDGTFIVSGVAEYVCKDALTAYNRLIDGGVAPEQARMILPQNMMTTWIWTGSLVAFARVCKLRLDPHAQAETAEIAQGISDIVGPLFPVSWEALRA